MELHELIHMTTLINRLAKRALFAEEQMVALEGQCAEWKRIADELKAERNAEREQHTAIKQFARDATRVRLALESEVKDLKDRLGAATAELAIIAKGYDEALELCDRDGMTPTEQIKELQSALAEEKKQREGFVASLCAELGVHGRERTVMAALEQLKSRVGPKAIVIPHRMEDMASAGLVRALPLLQPCDAAPSSEASHITQVGEAEVKKALTRPVYSSCTCHLDAPCSHCTWYADRGLSEPEEAASGLVIQD